MIGLTIFSHSLRQVLGNMGMAVRVSWWLVALVAAVWFVASMTLPEPVMLALQGQELAPGDLADVNGGAVLLGSALLIAFLVFVLWAVSLIAIVWHRYILLEEIPHGTIPYLPEFRVGRYFWVGIGISLIAALVAALVGGILGMILGLSLVYSPSATAGGYGMGAAILAGILTGMVMAVLYLRLALVLPAIALDEGLSMGKAWEATSGYSGAIFVLALVMAVVNVAVPMVLELIVGMVLPAFATSLLIMAYNWFYFILNISILSTLYGYIVQKREVY